MTKRWAMHIGILVATATALSASRSGVAAQGEMACDAALDHVAILRQISIGSDLFHYYGSGDVRAHCRDQETSMQSDSVAWFQDRGRFDFTGRVIFQDTTVSLEADRATYFLLDERLEAYGNVRLVNSQTGTTLTGPRLTYWRQVPSLRDTTELLAVNRPTVEYRTVGEDREDDPYIIVGNSIRLVGNEIAFAWGDVNIDREAFHAEADSAELGLARQNGILVGNARVFSNTGSSTFQVFGMNIAFTSTENELNWVQTRDSARAESDEFTLTADTAEFHLADGGIQGGIAWGSVRRAIAVSETNTVTADSLEIDTPEQQLTQLRGFGSAVAVSVRDSLDEEGDWIGGDTLIADFAEFEEGARGLKLLTASGNAYALYRIFKLFSAEPDLNYSRGDQIIARFETFGIDQVEITGAADGVHLEPIGIQRARQ